MSKCTVCEKVELESGTICKPCRDDGWVEASSPEGIDLIANDPILSKHVGIVSPLQPPPNP